MKKSELNKMIREQYYLLEDKFISNHKEISKFNDDSVPGMYVWNKQTKKWILYVSDAKNYDVWLIDKNGTKQL